MPSNPYKITPVDQMPGRRQTGPEGSLYDAALEDVLASKARYVKVEVPGRKPASITAGLKQAIARKPRRYGRLAVRQRGDQVFIEQSESQRQRTTQQRRATQRATTARTRQKKAA